MPRLPLFCLLIAFFGSPIASAGAPVAPATHASYSGTWAPDEAENARLAKQLRKEVQSMMPKGVSARGRGGMPGRDMPGDGGMPGGGMPGGGMPGGDMGGGMPGGGMPGGGMSGGRMRGGRGGPPSGMAPDAMNLLRPELDFAAPAQGNLYLLQDGGMLALGKSASDVVILPMSRATKIGDAGLTALATQSSGTLAVEFHSRDEMTVAHTYSLEADGARLRIRTHVSGGQLPMPNGIDMERVYDRLPGAASPAARH